MFSGLLKSVKKSISVFSLLALISVSAFADSWILGAQQFTYTQKSALSSTQNSISSLLPQLILEQISSEAVRITTPEEMSVRQGEKLLSERQSLYLQLSKEVQVRDSLVLQEKNPSKLKKLIEAENEKIKAIQEDIDENLKQQEKLNEELKAAVNKSERKSGGIEFFTQNNSVLPSSQSEKVTLYKNDCTSLYVIKDQETLSERQIENQIVKDKINGLLTGKITAYGDYFLVTAEVHVFPGNILIASAAEVGDSDSIQTVAADIAQAIIPDIANEMPCTLIFRITPEELKETARMKIDGVVYNSIPESITIDSGSHYLEFSCDGYRMESFTWNFTGSPDFLVSVPFQPLSEGSYNLSVKSSVPGSVYLNGQLLDDSVFAGKINRVTVNGNAVLGEYVIQNPALKQKTENKESAEAPEDKENESKAPEDKSIKSEENKVPPSDENKSETKDKESPLTFTGFFYIPSDLQIQDANLSVELKNLDRSSYIDKRRIWSYRGYSALILSLPATFISSGMYNNSYNAYSVTGSEDMYARAQIWNAVKYVSIGVTSVSAGFFIFELVRYFKAASSILPVEAKINKHHKAVTAEESTFNAKSQESENLNNENNDIEGESKNSASGENDKSVSE